MIYSINTRLKLILLFKTIFDLFYNIIIIIKYLLFERIFIYIYNLILIIRLLVFELKY
jgi:hypothetical protein